MLSRNFTQQLIPWLTLYLLVVSVGLPLQRVYCACLGEASLGLAGGGEHSCGIHPEKVDQANHHRTACCLVTKGCQKTDSVDHHCGDTEVFVAAFSADYLADFSSYLELRPVPGLIPAAPAYRMLGVQVVARVRPIRGPDPPARPAGRELLVAYQTFLI